MKWIGAIKRWWRRREYARQRKLDIKRVWPLIRSDVGGDLDAARAKFFFYVQSSGPQWLSLAREQIMAIIGRLR
jgi:hypothetical protein